MRARDLAWPLLLVLVSAVVAWKAARGAFAGMERFPLVFAGVVAVLVGADLLLAVRSRQRLRALLAALALLLAGWAALAHDRLLAERRAAAETRGAGQWRDREVGELAYRHGWNTAAPSGVRTVGARTTLVNFWGTWCDPCVREMPHLDAVWRRHHGGGLEILGLTTDFSNGGEPGLERAREEIDAFLRRVPVGYPVLLLEPEAFAAFRVESYPTTLWLEDGVVKGYFVGIDGTYELLAELGL
jgi:thiol-disulfide isomerase/thioredoxin